MVKHRMERKCDLWPEEMMKKANKNANVREYFLEDSILVYNIIFNLALYTKWMESSLGVS